MDNKIKLFTVASLFAVMATGCTNYNNDSNTTGSNGYSSGGSQNSGSGQVANNQNTCTPCTARKQTYVYKPRTVAKPKPTYRPPARTTYRPPAKATGSHNQQYYVDRWNRQQNQNRTRTVTKNTTRNTRNTNNYGSGYYTPPSAASSTTYYDYSSAARKTNTNTGRVLTTSNKSIYTGSYQKRTYKPYKPTTYAGGGKTTTYKPATYSASSTGGSGSYTVKKGDTVFEIMRQTGVYWKDIIRLNNLTAPYNISPGQRIRLK